MTRFNDIANQYPKAYGKFVEFTSKQIGVSNNDFILYIRELPLHDQIMVLLDFFDECSMFVSISYVRNDDNTPYWFEVSNGHECIMEITANSRIKCINDGFEQCFAELEDAINE